MKKLLSTLMALTMAMSISTTAFATDTQPTYTFNKDTGELVVYSDIGYEEFFENYIKENGIDEDEFYMKDFYEMEKKIKALKFGKDVTNFNFLAMSFENLESIEVDKDNQYFCVVDKGLYSKDKTKLYAYPYASDDVDVYLPSECVDIEEQWMFTNVIMRDFGDNSYDLWFKVRDKKYNLYFADPTGEQVENIIIHEPGMVYSLSGLYSATDVMSNEMNWRIFAVKLNAIQFILSEISYMAKYYDNIDVDYLEDFQNLCDNDPRFKELEDTFNQKMIDEFGEDYKDKDSRHVYDSIYFEQYMDFCEEYANILMDIFVENGYDKFVKKYDMDSYDMIMEWFAAPRDTAKVYDSSIKITAENDKITAGKSATFTSEIKMPEGEITWYVDGEKAGTGKTFTAENLSIGEHKVKATVVYPNGITSESDEVIVTVEKQTFIQRVVEFFENISNFLTSIFSKIIGIFG